MHLDPSETQLSGLEPEDEPGRLTVSAVAHDGFVLSWNLTTHSVYDSFTVEFADVQQLWDVREVPLPGNAAGTSLRGLKALTEYQIKLYGVIGNQRSALLEAVAVTGIRYFFRVRDAQCSFLPYFSIFYSNVISVLFELLIASLLPHWKSVLLQHRGPGLHAGN